MVYTVLCTLYTVYCTCCMNDWLLPNQTMTGARLPLYTVYCLLQVTGGSGAMEPAALAASLQFLKDAGLRIQHLVTDRSSTVRAMLKEMFPEINNQADPWHYIKVCISERCLGKNVAPIQNIFSEYEEAVVEGFEVSVGSCDPEVDPVNDQHDLVGTGNKHR